MPPLKDCSDVEYLVDEETLMIRKTLNIQIKKDYVEQQRDNILHIRCHINNKICSMIIDSEICANVTSIILVRKLSLDTIKKTSMVE
jgi:hypothetical protein